MRRLRAKVPSLLLSLVLLTIALTLESVPGPAPSAEAQTAPGVRLDEILKVGDPAPGFGPGATISAIGDVPRIAEDGSISLVVLVQGVPDATGVQAIYRVTDGPPELVFRSGDPAPEGDTFQRFPGLPQTPRIDQGRLTFAGSEGPAGGPGRDGIWSDRFGAFDLLLRVQDHLPGMPADGRVFRFGFVTRGETVLVDADYSQGANVPAENQGLWRNRTGSWDVVLINGMQAPGLGAGVAFDTDPTSAYGPLFGWRARNDGRVLAQAWVSGSGITEDNDEALWIERDAGLSVLVREGDPAPLPGTKPGRGATFGPTVSSPTFGSDGENAVPAINDAGAVVFGAVLRTRDGRLNSLWTTRSGSLQLLAKGSVPLADSAPGSPAPGLPPPGATFATFSTASLNGRGTIAFEGFANEFGDATNLTEGIWWDRSGQLALVAAEGRPVPGAAGATFQDLFLGSLEEDGSLFFTGRFELNLAAVSLTNARAEAGRLLFLNDNIGKCNRCHGNAGANVPATPTTPSTNNNFDTGVERFPNPARSVENFPFDGGFGTAPFDCNGDGVNDCFGDGTFNTAGLVEAADTGPFFHSNTHDTIEDAVAFFTSPEFNNSPSGRFLGGIVLNSQQISDIGDFLRVVNAAFNVALALQRNGVAIQLENSSSEEPQSAPCTVEAFCGGEDINGKRDTVDKLLSLSNAEIQDAVDVLQAKGLHGTAVTQLQTAISKNNAAILEGASNKRQQLMVEASNNLNNAKAQFGTGLNFTLGDGNLTF